VPVPREDLSFWVDTPDERPCPPLQGEARAAVAVVGGGFAGLSAAYHLSRERPDLDMVLLEGAIVGSGASGRNTGMLGPRVGGMLKDLCRKFGEPEGRRLYQYSLDAVALVKKLVHDEGLACELEDTAQVKAAVTDRQATALGAEAALLEKLGLAAAWYDERKMAEIAPVPYRAGLCYPVSGLLNPVRLCRELKRVLLARGVRVHEHTPVSGLAPGPPPRLTFPGGTLAAAQVVVATNAYTPQIGLLRGQLVPIQTHIIQTERLTPAQLGRLNWPGRTPFFEASNLFNYYRLTRDDRIVFGGGRPLYQAAAGDRHSGATDVADPRVWEAQKQVFKQRFPALADVAIPRQWSGSVAMTLDHLPVTGELAEAPGVFFAGGWNGHGVALATASGATVADLLLRRPSARTEFPWVRGRAGRIPGDPLRALGLSAYLTGLGLADRLERLGEKLRGGGARTRPSAGSDSR
jgi:gamma-glutamylputrescine oxidase